MAHLKVTRALGRGSWGLHAADTALLTLEARRGAQAFVTTGGLEITRPDLAVTLRSGDALELEDGRLIEIVAATETILEARGDADTLLRLAHQLGEHHQSIQIVQGRLRVSDNPALARLIEQAGAQARALMAPFDPQGEPELEAAQTEQAGGCGCGHNHAHGHTHEEHAHEDHAHEHDAHEHGHGGCCGGKHTHTHTHDHAHDPAHGDTCCGGKHGHGHKHTHEHDHAHDHGHAHAHPHR